MTPEKKAMRWFTKRDTGLSSEAIMAHMIGGVSTGHYPHDPADLGRCLRLLKAVPEWRPRIGEMKKYGPVWKALVGHWEDLEKSMKDEVGIDWSKGTAAPKTYQLMGLVLYPAQVKANDARLAKIYGKPAKAKPAAARPANKKAKPVKANRRKRA